MSRWREVLRMVAWQPRPLVGEPVDDEVAAITREACRLADDKARLLQANLQLAAELGAANGRARYHAEQAAFHLADRQQARAELTLLRPAAALTAGDHERNCLVLSERLAELREENRRLEIELREARGERPAQPVLLRSLGGLK